jgi:hypothetical protein
MGGKPLVSFRWLLAEPDTPQSTGAGRIRNGSFGVPNGNEQMFVDGIANGIRRPNTGKPVHRTIPKADVRCHLALALSRPFWLKNTQLWT